MPLRTTLHPTRARLRAAILVALLTVPWRAASTQSASVSGPPMEVDAQLRSRLIATMERDLTALVTAQQSYLGAYDEYASSFERGAIKGVKLRPSPGVTVTITYATKQTFAARATHDWLPGRSCVMKVGSVAASRIPTTTNEKKGPSRNGVPVCDSK
ncbi:MAG: hypothetical protein ACKVS7_14590 [Gemmatimonadaceae bacterium]